MKMNLVPGLVATAILFWAGFAVAQDGANGPDIVVFADDGKVLGSYSRVSGTNWDELDANGKPVFQLIEVSRDDGGIHLQDETRGIAVTLDTAKQIITFGQIGDAQQEPLYTIVEVKSAAAGDAAAADPPVADSVVFGSNGEVLGSYVNSSPGVWDERDKDGKKLFTFAEEIRSNEKILLKDETRRLALTLDLANKAITFGPIGDEEQQALYDILESAGSPPATAEDNTDIAAAAQADAASDADTAPDADAAAMQMERLAASLARPSQIKLKNAGAYPARFTVTWLEGEGGEQQSWDSGEKQSPYFEVLPLPRTAQHIAITAEGQGGEGWNRILAVSLNAPNNKCFTLSGTANNQIWDSSAEPSDNSEDDCP